MDQYVSDAAVARAAQWIADATGILVTAGAGMGVDSGLPDFRGNQGFWKAYPALGASRIEFTEIACPDAFKRTPELAWGFYGHRLNMYRTTPPHAGFAMLRQWIASKRDGGAVFTSNVDGSFRRAGFDPALIVECHGSLDRLQCMQPCSEATWSADAFEPQVDDESCRLLSPLPRCPHCGALARPNVLMFGDWSWSGDAYALARMRLDEWVRSVEKLVVIELGAGLAIPTVRAFSENQMRRGAHLVRINPRDFKVAMERGQGLAMGALEGVERIASKVGLT